MAVVRNIIIIVLRVDATNAGKLVATTDTIYPIRPGAKAAVAVRVAALCV